MAVPPPAVSVIIPCFNLGDFVKEAVESVLTQSFQDFEILLVDDGSTDVQTQLLLGSFSRPKTTVYRTPNRGLAAARNFLLQHARGTYICALDADDRLHPEFLQKTVAQLENDPSLAFASCWLDRFGDEQGTWTPERCDFPTLLAECTVCTASLVRRTAVMAVGGFDERMPHPGYEDWDLWVSLVERGFRGCIIPEILFHYRRRSGSMTDACCVPPQHTALMRYMVSKHQASYDEHLLGVLMHKERELGALLRANLAAERELATWYEPLVEARRRELQRLEDKLARAPQAVSSPHVLEAEELEQLRQRLEDTQLQASATHHELERSYAEVRALRNSWSWRLTAPLRRALDLLRGR